MTVANYSIRRRLTALLLGSVGLLVLVANLVLGVFVSHRLQTEYDSSLLAKARALASLTEQDLEGFELEFADAIMPEFEAEENPEYFQLWLEDGSVLGRSHSLAAQEQSRSPGSADTVTSRQRDLPQRLPLSEHARFRDLTLPDGRLGRLVQIDFLPHIDDDARALIAPESQQHATIVVAQEREQLDTLLNGLHMALFAISIVLLILIVIVVRFVVKAGLNPLQEIRKQLETLDVDSLHTRLKTRQPTVELNSVIKQFNSLLERLEAAFSRERQFTADVAHELRTPLAELRNLCEVTLRWPEDSAMRADFFDEALKVTLQMERIVVNLLALARCDNNLDVIEKTGFDLSALIDKTWQHVAPEAAQKQLRFRCEGPAQLTVYTGRDQLERILNNLLSNAVVYSPADTDVICTVTVSENTVTLSITNNTEHLQADDLPLMFDRLWRKDPARAGGSHAGLGLALVAAYAKQIQLTVKIALEHDQIFRITLSGLKSV